jgi:hypothetical protein
MKKKKKKEEEEEKRKKHWNAIQSISTDICNIKVEVLFPTCTSVFKAINLVCYAI